jgi:Flp pilus assembly protein TadG
MMNFCADRCWKTRLSSERGVSLIHVAISIFVLLGLSTFVLDYGVMWLGRGQAQNAADAGALAGAIARAFDETADPPEDDGDAFTSASETALLHQVVGEAPGVAVTWECPAFAAGAACVRVDVFRDGTNASTMMPTFLANMFGIDSQPMRATATAWVTTGNSTNCMRPFTVADRWIEVVSSPGPGRGGGGTLEYDHWIGGPGGSLVELNPADTYIPPQQSGTTGYKALPPPDGQMGTELPLKNGNPSSSNEPIQPGWTLAVRLPDGEGGYLSGAAEFSDAIANCIGNPVGIGQYLPTETGVMMGPTGFGFNDLKAKDPLAVWNPSTLTVDNSCVDETPSCGSISPRVIPIAVFDMDDYQKRQVINDWSVCPIGGKCVKVVNILGFFADRLEAGGIVGYLVSYPGEFNAGFGNVVDDSAFLKTIQLIR